MASQLKKVAIQLFDRMPSLRRLLRQAPKEDLLLAFCLTLIVCIAVTVRVLPYNWGYQLSEFDPYFHYEVAEYVVQNGLPSWYDWHTDQAWYPAGRDIGSTSYPGLPFSSAVLYLFLTGIGIQTTVYNVCIAFPVLMAALTCVVLFYLGKDVGGSKVGLLAALFLALSPAFINRTSLGFFDTENLGIFGILVTSLFYLRSIEENRGRLNSLVYSILAGLFLGYVYASWGASRYASSLLALFTFVLVIAKRYSQRLLVSYSVLTALSFIIALGVPKLSVRFITEFESLAVFGILLILVMKEITSRLATHNLRLIFTTVFLLVIGCSALVLSYFNIIQLPATKFLSVLNPFQRSANPLVESVQEHRPATWSAFYYQFGLLVFLAPLGIFFTMQRLTAKSLFMITFMLTTLYFSASMIRLTIVLAPALGVLGALALVEVLRPFVNIVTQRTFTRRRRLSMRVGRGFSAIFILGLFILAFLPLLRGVDSAYSPTTIASSSIPLRANIGDWEEALAWMKENLPRDTVVASWWDYGYWITVKGDKITLADNGTINQTQIAQIGRMFMSNETQALVILNEYDVDYVTVFTTITLAQQGQILYGDEVKWRWMAKIGGLDDVALEDTSITSQIADAWSTNTQNQNLLNWYERFAQLPIPKTDTVLTKLMLNGAFGILPPDHFQLSFSSNNELVFIYKVMYPSSYA